MPLHYIDGFSFSLCGIVMITLSSVEATLPPSKAKVTTFALALHGQAAAAACTALARKKERKKERKKTL